MDTTTQRQSDTDTITRRNFLKLGLGALSTLAVLELGGAGLLFLEARAEEGEFGGMVEAGTTDTFPAGSVTEFAGGNFFLIRAHDGGFLAVYRRCPHLGCTVNWIADQEQFYCPCHASSFDFYGDYERPPVPRALDTFDVLIAGDRITVDTTHIHQRERFAREQLVYA